MNKIARYRIPAILALAVVFLTFALVACGGNEDAREDVPTATAASAPSSETSPTSDTVRRTPASAPPTATPVAGAQDASPAPPYEFLTICEQADLAFEEEPRTVKEAEARIREVIELLESVEPPEGFAGWRNAMVVYMEAVEKAIRDAPGPGERASQEEVEEHLFDIMLPVAFQHFPKVIEAVKVMDRDAVAGLIEAGCIDEESISVMLTDEEMKKLGLGEGDWERVISEFASISAGAEHTCGVGVDGSVVCWGDDGVGQSTPPYGQFASVSAGHYHTCGVRTDGTVACWGDDGDGKSAPPDGEFFSVSAGDYHTCGVRVDGAVVCWGLDSRPSTPPDGEFLSVSAGDGHTCGLKTNGSVACWGYDDYGQSTPPDGEFDSVSAGWEHTCGVRTDGTVACWGDDGVGQSTPPDGEFVSVSAGARHTCGVMADGSVACWGYDEYGQSTPLDGEFDSVGAGGGHTCGVRPYGSVECWGSDSDGRATPPGSPSPVGN